VFLTLFVEFCDDTLDDVVREVAFVTELFMAGKKRPKFLES